MTTFACSAPTGPSAAQFHRMKSNVSLHHRGSSLQCFTRSVKVWAWAQQSENCSSYTSDQYLCKQESLANAKVSARQLWHIVRNSLNRRSLVLGTPSSINVIYVIDKYFQCTTITSLTMRVYHHSFSRCSIILYFHDLHVVVVNVWHVVIRILNHNHAARIMHVIQRQRLLLYISEEA